PPKNPFLCRPLVAALPPQVGGKRRFSGATGPAPPLKRRLRKSYCNLQSTMDMETYRLFIGAELPEDVKAELVASQARLRRANLPVAWVAPEAMHLTLRFLGDTSVALIPELCAAIRTAVAPYHAMELRLSGTGAFPNDRRPSVVWIGVGGAVAALGHAQASIGTAPGGLGIAPQAQPLHPPPTP